MKQTSLRRLQKSLKTAYFPKESDKLVEDTIVEEGTGELDEKKEPLLAPDMQQYTQAITKLKPLG